MKKLTELDRKVEYYKSVITFKNLIKEFHEKFPKENVDEYTFEEIKYLLISEVR